MKNVLLGVFLGIIFTAANSFAAAPRDCLKAVDANNEVQALEICEPLAKKGDAQASLQLGKLYASLQSYDKAVVWYELSAKQGNPEGYNNIGAMYLRSGLEGKYHKALEYFHKAADAGNIAALNHIGVIYAQGGYGITQDYDEAKKWLTKAVKQGYRPAEKSLLSVNYEQCGLLYKKEQFDKAIAQCQPFAEQGIALFETLMGNMYLTGGTIPKDYNKAYNWFKKAADQGDADGLLKLGYMFYEGNGTQQDYAKAFTLIKQSAEKDWPDAENALAKLYLTGKGTEQNLEEGYKWHASAAKHGNAESQNMIGMLYASKKQNYSQISQDYSKAYMWLSLAEKGGYAKAEQLLAAISQVMTPEQIAEGKRLAAEWKPSS